MLLKEKYFHSALIIGLAYLVSYAFWREPFSLISSALAKIYPAMDIHLYTAAMYLFSCFCCYVLGAAKLYRMFSKHENARETDKRVYYTYPWRHHAIVWGLFLGFLLPLGVFDIYTLHMSLTQQESFIGFLMGISSLTWLSMPSVVKVHMDRESGPDHS